MWRKLIFLLSLVGSQVWGQGGLVFIENQNQWKHDIDFQARAGGRNILISPGKIGIHLFDQENNERHHLESRPFEESGGMRDAFVQNHYFEINFIGSNATSSPHGADRAAGYYNYFLGNDPCRWASNVSGYETIIYPEIYNGIDLRISSLGANLKYDFIVKAGADPNQIKIEYCGLDGIEQENGDLVLKTMLGNVVEKSPVSYQLINQKKNYLSSEFYLNQNEVSFFFPDGYDECEELVIDPLLIFSTYSGSLADNWGSTATPGEHGTLYSSGVTNHHVGTIIEGAPFPATPGAFQTNYGGDYDIAVIKYDSTGSQFLYATYLGGTGNETPHSLLMDKNTEDLIVLGTTSSNNFPTSANAYDRTFNFGQPVETNVIPYGLGSDIIITRLNKFGNQLVGSTYIGGNLNDGLNAPGGPLARNYGDEMRGDVITDEEGDIYISSVTNSTNFPTTDGFGKTYFGGGSDAVVMKLKADLTGIMWSGFLGGAFYDASYSIKFDKNKNILVAGGTSSGNFPATVGAYQATFGGDADGFITRIAADGSAILTSTFTGTIKYDQIYFIDQNSAGEIFCFGQTTGSMPITAGTYNNPKGGQFLQKFSDDLSTLKISTIFGSGVNMPNISPTAFLVNECDNIFLSGWGGGINLIDPHYLPINTFGMAITSDAVQKTTSGSDFYFAVLNSDATELKYGTYLGGTNSKTHVDGGTSRFDKFGVVYHAVCAGCAALNNTRGPTSDFPTTPNAKSRTNNSKNCNNAAFKFDLASLRARFQTNTVRFDLPNFNNVCFPDSIVFQNRSTGGEIFIWTFGDGTVITRDNFDTTSVVHQFATEGTYTVKLKVIDYSTCKATDSTTKVIHYFKDEISVMDDATICEGDAVKLIASGGINYKWISQDTTFQSNESNPKVSPPETTYYKVKITDADGCTRQDTVLVDVIPSMDLQWELKFITDCVSQPSIHVRNISEQEPDVSYWFNFGDGQTSDEQEVTHTFEHDSTYTIKLLGQREFCVFDVSEAFPFYTLFVPNIITPTQSEGLNDNFIIGFGKDHIPADAGITVSLTIVDRWGKNVFETEDYRNDWDGRDLEGGVYYVTMKLGDLATCKTWVHVVK